MTPLEIDVWSGCREDLWFSRPVYSLFTFFKYRDALGFSVERWHV